MFIVDMIDPGSTVTGVVLVVACVETSGDAGELTALTELTAEPTTGKTV